MNLLYSSSLGIVSDAPSTATTSSLLKAGNSDSVNVTLDRGRSQIGESSSPDSHGCNIVTRPDSSGSCQSIDTYESSSVWEAYSVKKSLFWICR